MQISPIDEILEDPQKTRDQSVKIADCGKNNADIPAFSTNSALLSIYVYFFIQFQISKK
jgi:hypothetical protein